MSSNNPRVTRNQSKLMSLKSESASVASDYPSTSRQKPSRLSSGKGKVGNDTSARVMSKGLPEALVG
jgi:hypothetical protein